jgi:hypothetical protein
VDLPCQAVALSGRGQFLGLDGVLAQALVRVGQLVGQAFDLGASRLLACRDLDEGEVVLMRRISPPTDAAPRQL